MTENTRDSHAMLVLKNTSRHWSFTTIGITIDLAAADNQEEEMRLVVNIFSISVSSTLPGATPSSGGWSRT